MSFECLKKIASDDTTTDFQQALVCCRKAEEELQHGNPDVCIDKYNQALNTVIRCVYKREGLDAPKVQKPESGPKPTNADFMHRDSPFAAWLGNQKVLDLCHQIRRRRNRTTPGHAEEDATNEQALLTGKRLEVVLQTICEKLKQTAVRNPNGRHQPCVILLDLSGSMLGPEGTPAGSRPIDELNRAIRSFRDDLRSLPDINFCTEISFITFSDEVDVIQPFKYADEFNLPELVAGGQTAMNEAIDKALEIIEAEKKIYHREDVDYYRPWIFLLTDGFATDNWREAATEAKLKDAIKGNHVVFYPVLIGEPENGSDKKLKYYFPDSMKEEERILIKAGPGRFKELFKFFTNSIKATIKNQGSTDPATAAKETHVVVENV